MIIASALLPTKENEGARESDRCARAGPQPPRPRANFGHGPCPRALLCRPSVHPFTASTKLIAPTVLRVLGLYGKQARWSHLRLTQFSVLIIRKRRWREFHFFFFFCSFSFFYSHFLVCAEAHSWLSLPALLLTFRQTETGQLQSAHIALHQRQLALQQVQEPPGEHHAFRVHPRLPAAHPRRRRLRLHQRQLH